jgi:peptidoglycan/LPS O-acetylase OafA/YrhL
MEHRSAHYWLWFLFFGVIATLVAVTQQGKPDSEALWLLVAGALGLIFGASWLADGKLSRPYDFVAGIIFTLVGVIGILGAFKINLLSSLPSNVVSDNHVLGLSILLLPSLVHTVLGLNSLNHALRSGK